MAKLTFLALAQQILREEKKPLSPTEIWKIAVAKGLDKQLEIKGKTPDATLYSVIFTNTRGNQNTAFVKIGERPARYFLKELVSGTTDLDGTIATPDDSAPELYEYSEADLHPFLAYYARIYFKAYTKTIRHSTSKKKEFGEWVHPDIIGVYYAVEEWVIAHPADKSLGAGRLAR
jgi:hypothetical protein